MAAFVFECFELGSKFGLVKGFQFFDCFHLYFQTGEFQVLRIFPASIFSFSVSGVSKYFLALKFMSEAIMFVGNIWTALL